MRVHGEGVRSSMEPRWDERLVNVGTRLLRYGLVFLLVVIGSMKFFDFEANGIQPLVPHSPFLKWIYRVLSVRGASDPFGLFEIETGTLIALRHVFPKASAIGNSAGIVIFLTTLSFLSPRRGHRQRAPTSAGS